MKPAARVRRPTIAIVVIMLWSPTALADQLGARYEQNLVNGDGVLNGAVLNGAWASSFAATFEDELSVADRPRPDYQPKGIPVGAFRLFPFIDVGAGYTDNVFFTEQDAKQDFLYSVAPELTLQSQWAEDLLTVYGGVQQLNYAKYDAQGFTNAELGGSTRIVVRRDTDVRINSYYDFLHEPLSSPDTPGNSAKPTGYALFHADGAIDHKPNRFGVTVGASHDDYSYDSTALVGGGARDNHDRDEDIDTFYGRASYDFSPGYTGFFGASYDARSFQLDRDRNGFDRDSNGVQVNGGLDLLFTRLIRGQLFVGYQVQAYHAPLPDVRTVNYGADINWYATPLLTAHVSAGKSVDDTTLPGASATEDQSLSAGVDYELLRNLIVQANVGYTDSKFVGIARDDKVAGGGIGVKWLLNRNLVATANYDFARRNSNATGQDYSDNQVLIGVRAQL